MPADVQGWLDIVDRLDVWGLAVLCAVCFWKIVRTLDDIRRMLALHKQGLEALEMWRRAHMDNDREEHRRLYDKIDENRRAVAERVFG